MTNQVASTSTTNIVPVQAVFDVNGNCLGLIGPGGNYFSPPLTADTIVNAKIDNSVIGGTTPAAGTFTNINFTNILNGAGGLIYGVAPVAGGVTYTITVGAGGAGGPGMTDVLLGGSGGGGGRGQCAR